MLHNKYHSGRVFKQNATVAIEFYAQNPHVKFIASAKQWNSAGYKIKDGGEAIHFVDNNGNHSDLFDLSQIEGGLAPKIWQINKESAEQVKSALGISEDDELIDGVIAQTIDTSQITDCMAALDIPPNVFEPFKEAYMGAVQTIIAGRFEIGGNVFNINPDLSVIEALDDSRKMHFLTLVADTARQSLLAVEKIANEISTQISQERIEKNDLQRMGSSDNRATGQDTGQPTSDNSEPPNGCRKLSTTATSIK
ncbi:MAG: hypothetical protein LBC86_06960 [Oscillospiraceae bacterium]|jgi:hypothetical protein|nr:hypothetical protein [Oscillospiraceae bacterium]